MYDFDIMMQRTKEERRILHNKRRKGSKDIEMINDNDDAIAGHINSTHIPAEDEDDTLVDHFVKDLKELSQRSDASLLWAITYYLPPTKHKK